MVRGPGECGFTDDFFRVAPFPASEVLDELVRISFADHLKKDDVCSINGIEDSIFINSESIECGSLSFSLLDQFPAWKRIVPQWSQSIQNHPSCCIVEPIEIAYRRGRKGQVKLIHASLFEI
jgi:hypothetical protein